MTASLALPHHADCEPPPAVVEVRRAGGQALPGFEP